MSKTKQLYKLRNKISIKLERIKVLLEHVIFKTDEHVEMQVLAEISFDELKRIDRMSKKMGQILLNDKINEQK